MFFNYSGALAQRQIVSFGSPSFQPSPISPPTTAHAVAFTTSGTYRFHDSFNNALNGQVVVP